MILDWRKRLYDFVKKEENKLNIIKNQFILLIKTNCEYTTPRENSIDISPSLLQDIKNIGQIKHKFKYIPAVLLQIDKEEEILNINLEKNLENILKLEANSKVSIPEPIKGKDIRPERLWNLEMIQAYKAQKISKGKGIVVAVVDTGADYTHPEIENRFGKEKGYNFVDETDDPYDDHFHGTHCSGTIAGETVGVAPRVTLKAVKFLNSQGGGTLSDAIRSIEWCIEHGVDITSNSWGSSQDSEALEDIFDEAYNRGILSVAAAGNSGFASEEYPPQYESVMSIPAVDKNEKRAVFSTIFKGNDVAAPGVDVYSCVPGGRYETHSGTSMACPHCSGSAAVIMSFLRENNKQTRARLKKYAKKKGSVKEYGTGIIQLFNCLTR